MENIFTHWESVINFTRNDIVFEYQNKQYGAYAIRKYYPERLRNAFLYTVAGMCLLLAVPFAIQKLFPAVRHIVVPPNDPIAVLPHIFVTEIIPTVNQTKQEKKVKSEDPYYRASNDRVETSPNPQEAQTQPTENTGTVNTDGGEPPTTGGAASGPIIVEPPSDTVKFASIMPSFDGLEAWLRAHTGYPYRAREVGAHGKVYITFVVDKNGKVTKAFVARGIQDEGGDMLEAEALRVVRSMPDWQPGINNGYPIAVQLTLPINFVLKEK